MPDDHKPEPSVRPYSDISDLKLKDWLAERIVRLELARFELAGLQEQLDAHDLHADYLHSRGEEVDVRATQQREELAREWQAKHDEIQAALEPTASHPFRLEEEMNLYCQGMLDVNARLKLVEEWEQRRQSQASPQKSALAEQYRQAEQARKPKPSSEHTHER